MSGKPMADQRVPFENWRNLKDHFNQRNHKIGAARGAGGRRCKRKASTNVNPPTKGQSKFSRVSRIGEGGVQ